MYTNVEERDVIEEVFRECHISLRAEISREGKMILHHCQNQHHSFFNLPLVDPAAPIGCQGTHSPLLSRNKKHSRSCATRLGPAGP